MIDLSDKENWYQKGTSKAIVYEYIKEYDLTDEEIDALCKYVCSYIIVSLYEEFEIDDDPLDAASVLYHGEKALLAYLGTVDPDLINDKVFKMQLLNEDRERVLEEHFLYDVIRSAAKDFDYERYEDAIGDMFYYLVKEKEENLQLVREDLVK